VSIVGWIVIGLVAGLIGRRVVGDRQHMGCIYTVAIGVLGALIGGALMQAAGRKGALEFDWRTLLVAALGSILLLLVLQAISGRSPRGTARRR
jgi:uncharacterized membrane protein YeaQ/YmgE (transglycosylase-associated protein family)